MKHLLSQRPFLIVPSTSFPPRVPKLLQALIYKLDIIDYKWVTDSLAAKRALELSPYKMECQDLSALLSPFNIQLP